MVRNSTESLVRVALLWVLVGAMAAPARAGPIPQPLLQAGRARAAGAHPRGQIVGALGGAAPGPGPPGPVEHRPPPPARVGDFPLRPDPPPAVVPPGPRRDPVRPAPAPRHDRPPRER